MLMLTAETRRALAAAGYLVGDAADYFDWQSELLRSFEAARKNGKTETQAAWMRAAVERAAALKLPPDPTSPLFTNRLARRKRKAEARCPFSTPSPRSFRSRGPISP